jgi:hypothetical protein
VKSELRKGSARGRDVALQPDTGGCPTDQASCRRPPQAPTIPEIVWINPPIKEVLAHIQNRPSVSSDLTGSGPWQVEPIVSTYGVGL